ncbi:Hint domain-containing protein [Acetobacter sp. DsW_063]|uniref:Hint domain-containing protein n=1 Tax=Acetobacter sp. DsW_063 TaxID=1514894 RepID=UPI000A3ACFB7|nr:Hint domain-containing protein [Acetobacter sp. DsW_063]
MTNPSIGVNFNNTAGTYVYDTSTTYGDYTNANNTGIIAEITNGAAIVVNNLNLNESTLDVINGTFTVKAAANLNSGTINVSSGSTFIATSLTNLNTATININGGTVELEGSLANNNGAVVNFSNNPNGVLIISKSSQASDLAAITIENYVYGATIEVASSDSGTLTTSYDSTNHTLTVLNGSTAVLTFTNFTEATGSLTPTAKYSNGYLIISCFLAQSMISTPDGEVAVEDIKVGDDVITFDPSSDAKSVSKVTWAGSKQIVISSGLPDDEAGYPVRVIKDAIADGVPHKDMLVTPEHCLFFDGFFVPVRMLVNGKSIFYDKSYKSYEYFHIETENHSIVSADGVLTETYLDTGDRRSFRHKGNVFSIGGRAKRWATDAAAPLNVERSFVEPLYHTLHSRAEPNVPVRESHVRSLDSDPLLHLITDQGLVIHCTRKEQTYCAFMIPAQTRNVRIVSRTARPCDLVGPYLDDRRQMGVAIGGITLTEGRTGKPVTVHLTEENLPGWHALGDNGDRWTAGDALLPLDGVKTPDSVALLSLEIVASGPYVISPSEHATVVRAA